MSRQLKEVGFGEDVKGESRKFTDIESLGQIFYNIFVMRPGSLPSMPEIGVDIRSYMYQLEGTIDTDSLKEKIILSCKSILKHMTIDDIQIQEVPYQNETLLLIIITVNLDDQVHALISAFRTTNSNDLLYSFRSEAVKL